MVHSVCPRAGAGENLGVQSGPFGVGGGGDGGPGGSWEFRAGCPAEIAYPEVLTGTLR